MTKMKKARMMINMCLKFLVSAGVQNDTFAQN